jgi:hypothetical protein
VAAGVSPALFFFSTTQQINSSISFHPFHPCNPSRRNPGGGGSVVACSDFSVCISATPVALDRYLAAFPAMSRVPRAPFSFQCLSVCLSPLACQAVALSEGWSLFFQLFSFCFSLTRAIEKKTKGLQA